MQTAQVVRVCVVQAPSGREQRIHPPVSRSTNNHRTTLYPLPAYTNERAWVSETFRRAQHQAFNGCRIASSHSSADSIADDDKAETADYVRFRPPGCCCRLESHEGKSFRVAERSCGLIGPYDDVLRPCMLELVLPRTFTADNG